MSNKIQKQPYGESRPSGNPAKFKILLFSVFCFLFSVFYFLLPTFVAQAASLYFEPSNGSYTVDEGFTVGVYVSSPDQAINAASSIITFPADKLEITSLAKNNSIFSLWVQEPTFSNKLGTINFEGIILNPGFKGSAGKIIDLNFKVKSAGLSSLYFSSSSVLANDGKGTNILKNLGNAQFGLNMSVSGPVAPDATTPSQIAGTPLAPRIFSSTHPDPYKWYSEKNAKFTWELPPGLTGVRVLVDKYPQSIPTVSYDTPIDSKEIANLADDVWYFHVQLNNINGWGGISHFRFQIDTEPPDSFSIKFIDSKETENPRPTITFDTVDSLSGIDYYKVKIGEGKFFTLSEDIVGNNPYTLPPQEPGRHTILVQAFDKAGNYATATEEFTIKALEPPIFTEYPSQQALRDWEALVIKGKTLYPEATVILWLQKENEEPKSQTAKSDIDGNFTIVYEKKLKDGIYKIWAEVVDERGGKSLPSREVVFVVALSPVLRFGKIVLDYLTVLISLLALIIFLILFIFYTKKQILNWRKKIKKETKEADTIINKEFEILREQIKEQIAKLDKQPGLSKEEKEIRNELQKFLDASEKKISKEVKDVKRELSHFKLKKPW